jgi:mRNA-degrading endonuclease RelE of RelBE toxin-antitoxin system
MDHLEKLLRRMPPKHRAQVLEALLCLQDESCRATLRMEKLSGSDVLYRIRTGRYRIIFTMQGNVVELFDIRLRNEGTYKNL